MVSSKANLGSELYNSMDLPSAQSLDRCERQPRHLLRIHATGVVRNRNFVLWFDRKTHGSSVLPDTTDRSLMASDKSVYLLRFWSGSFVLTAAVIHVRRQHCWFLDPSGPM
jgi:hypothetical protein